MWRVQCLFDSVGCGVLERLLQGNTLQQITSPLSLSFCDTPLINSALDKHSLQELTPPHKSDTLMFATRFSGSCVSRLHVHNAVFIELISMQSCASKSKYVIQYLWNVGQ